MRFKKSRRKVINDPKVVEISNKQPSPCDPNGSYTGVPVNSLETPVQDADDL